MPVSPGASGMQPRDPCRPWRGTLASDRKSTRLNSSHHSISYAVFCLKKKKKERGYQYILLYFFFFFFFNDTATTEIYTLSLHDALPIWNATPRSLSPLERNTGFWTQA